LRVGIARRHCASESHIAKLAPRIVHGA
jgi:hypothetical protein